MLGTALNPWDAVSGMQQCPGGGRQGNFCFSHNESAWSAVGFTAHSAGQELWGPNDFFEFEKREKQSLT